MGHDQPAGPLGLSFAIFDILAKRKGGPVARSACRYVLQCCSFSVCDFCVCVAVEVLKPSGQAQNCQRGWYYIFLYK